MNDNGGVLPLERLVNVRDLGGFAAADGRFVRRGLLYRAGELSLPSRGDRAALEKLALAAIVDFRSGEEAAKNPDCAISTVKLRAKLPIDAGNILALSRKEGDVPGETLMEDLYRCLAEDARPRYREFFAILADSRNAPLLFHCSAGKDRTGLAAALLLSALGVGREQVYRDYLLSAVCLEGKYQDFIEEDPGVAPLMTVKRSYLDAAFESIDGKFGGIERYLEAELGADTGRLRELYTARGFS
ncbi:MAG: tyrosine-protein phosphatase [Treponema sp.]|jgi:protein-tyrosine phosphatase|nr:tyrosine-protein phosphatase [Treponema sp.]